MLSFLYQAAFNAVWSFFLAAGRGSDLGAFFFRGGKNVSQEIFSGQGLSEVQKLENQDNEREMGKTHWFSHTHLCIYKYTDMNIINMQITWNDIWLWYYTIAPLHFLSSRFLPLYWSFWILTCFFLLWPVAGINLWSNLIPNKSSFLRILQQQTDTNMSVKPDVQDQGSFQGATACVPLLSKKPINELPPLGVNRSKNHSS